MARLFSGVLTDTPGTYLPLLLGTFVKPGNERGRTLGIGLHNDTEAVPFGKVWVAQQSLDDVQGKIEPVGFFRVDVETDVGLAGLTRQCAGPLDEGRDDGGPLGVLVPWVQGGQLD